jgi:hypothetical protein
MAIGNLWARLSVISLWMVSEATGLHESMNAEKEEEGLGLNAGDGHQLKVFPTTLDSQHCPWTGTQLQL